MKKIFLLYILATYLLPIVSSYAQNTINTIAGSGYDPTSPLDTALSGDGGPATIAAIYRPGSVITDGLGNIIFSDFGNNRIRKVDAGGIITTIAGSGSGYMYGFGGDGGAATTALLHAPTDICFNAAGDLYIADAENHRVRKISAATGMISTVVGNGSNTISGDGYLATMAGIGYPTSICFDASGNLYIATSSKIRKVAVGTGIITTYAGSTGIGNSGDGGMVVNAVFGNIKSIRFSSAGELYVADAKYNVVRKVAISHIITRVAGTGFYSSICELGGCDYIGSYNGEGGFALQTNLSVPCSIFINNAGTLFIADEMNNVIRYVTVDGIIHNLAGNAYGAAAGTDMADYSYSGGFFGDGGSAVHAELFEPSSVFSDNHGNIYIADTYNNRIRKVCDALGVNNTTVEIGKLTLFPNPSKGSFTISSNANSIILNVNIFNSLGQAIYHCVSNNTRLAIDLTNQPPGIYSVSVTQQDGNITVEKIVIN